MADAWYNDSATLRAFLKDLIEAEEITDLDEVIDYCEKPQKYTDAYNGWVENGYSFGSDDESEDEDES